MSPFRHTLLGLYKEKNQTMTLVTMVFAEGLKTTIELNVVL